jgi:putative phage-type endonuclease
MSYEVLCSAEDREDWLRQRRHGIGGSDIPAIIGLSSWQSALSVYVDKIGLGDIEDQKEQQEWGLLLEPVILKHWGDLTQRRVRRAGKLLRSREIPFAQCTLDGEQLHVLVDVPNGDVRHRTGNVQVKNYGGYAKWGDAVPPDVFAQCQWEMGVTERPFCSAVALLNGNKMVWADINYDDYYFSAVLVPAASEFWDRVQKGNPPDPDGKDISKEALKALYPKDSGTEIELPQRFIDFDDERENLKLIRKEADARIDELGNLIIAEIKDNTFGILPGGVVYTARWQDRKSYTVPAGESRPLTRSMKKRG